jgi:hypothetical protein
MVRGRSEVWNFSQIHKHMPMSEDPVRKGKGGEVGN